METPNHEGTVTLTHGGRAVPLRFTWAVIHGLQQERGLDDWMADVSAAIDRLDMDAMAKLMALVAGVSRAEAEALCVPVLPAKEALLRAWSAGMTGNVPQADDAEKAMPQLTSWGPLSKLLSALVSAGASSGPSRPTQPAQS